LQPEKQPETPPSTPEKKTPEGKAGEKTPEGTQREQTQDQQNQQNQNDQQQAETGERGAEASYDGPMFGDIIVPAPSFTTGVSPQVLALLGAAGSSAQTAQTTRALGGGSGLAGAVFPFHTEFKIAENELPRPLDRLFVTYNYYGDVAASGLAFGAPGAQVHRQMMGGEKTFLGGNASVGIRVPVFWVFGSRNSDQAQLGDISVVFKYAFVNNPRTGDAISAGFLVGAPTGPSLAVPGQSSIHSTQLVPWFGEIWHWGRLYNIDFTSLAVPTDARDVTLFFEDFALAYLLYRNSDPNRWLRAVVPDIECHANIPLNHGSLSDIPIGFPTTVDFTGGCYFFLGRGAVLGMGAGTPVTGPKPYSIEALATLNYIF
jgi:hypothetical protein